MTVNVQQAAATVANAPTKVGVAAISAIQKTLDTVKDLVDTGEASADQILDVVKTDLPGIEQPLLEALHLSVQAKTP